MSRLTASRALDVAILLLTIGYGVLFLLSEAFESNAGAVFERLDLIFTIVLLSAFLIQFLLAREKRRWLAGNWIDVVIVLIVVFPLLRILRFRRYLVLARMTRVGRVALIMSSGLRAHLRSYGRGNIYNIAATAVVVIVLAAILIQFAEDGAQESNIKSLGDAMWWAMATVTTVGYGDKFPTTVQGRVVAGALMVLGVALFGILTASLSSVFVVDARQPEMAKLHRELQQIREEIAALRDTVAGPGALSTGGAPVPAADGISIQVRAE